MFSAGYGAGPAEQFLHFSSELHLTPASSLRLGSAPVPAQLTLYFLTCEPFGECGSASQIDAALLGNRRVTLANHQ